MLSSGAADGGTLPTVCGAQRPCVITRVQCHSNPIRRLRSSCLIKSSAAHSCLSRKVQCEGATGSTHVCRSSIAMAVVRHAACPHRPRLFLLVSSAGAAAATDTATVHSRPRSKIMSRSGSATAAMIAAAAGSSTSTALAAGTFLAVRSSVMDAVPPGFRKPSTHAITCSTATQVTPSAAAAVASADPHAHAVEVGNVEIVSQPAMHPSPATSAVLRSQGELSTSYSSRCSIGSSCSHSTGRGSSIHRNAATWRDGGYGARSGAMQKIQVKSRSENVEPRGMSLPLEGDCTSAAREAAADRAPGGGLPLSGAALTEAITSCGTWKELAEVLMQAASLLNRTHVAAALVMLARMEDATAGRRGHMAGAEEDFGRGLAIWQLRSNQRQWQLRRKGSSEQLMMNRRRSFEGVWGLSEGPKLDPELVMELGLGLDAAKGSCSGGGAAAAELSGGGSGGVGNSSGPMLAAVVYRSKAELAVDLTRLALTHFLGVMSAREVSNIAWALARLKPSLQKEPSPRVSEPPGSQQKLPSFSLHAAAAALRKACDAHWDNFNAQELTTLLYGSVQLDPTALDPRDAHRPDTWLASWFAASERHVASLGPRGLTVVLWALVQIWGRQMPPTSLPPQQQKLQPGPQQQMRFPANWSTKLRARLASQLPHIYPAALVQVAWGLARLQPWMMPAGCSTGVGSGSRSSGHDDWEVQRVSPSGKAAVPDVFELSPPSCSGATTRVWEVPDSGATAPVPLLVEPDTDAAELLSLLTRAAIRKAPQLESLRDLSQLSWAIGKLQESIWGPEGASVRSDARRSEARTAIEAGKTAAVNVELKADSSVLFSTQSRTDSIMSEVSMTAEFNGGGWSKPASHANGHTASVTAPQPASVSWQRQEQQQQQSDTLQMAEWSWDQGPAAGWDDVARAEPQLPPRPESAKRAELVSLIARPARPAPGPALTQPPPPPPPPPLPAITTTEEEDPDPAVQAELQPPISVQQCHASPMPLDTVLQGSLVPHALPSQSPRTAPSASDSGDGGGADDEGDGNSPWEEQQRRHPPRPLARRLGTIPQLPLSPFAATIHPHQQQQPALHSPQHWQGTDSPERQQPYALQHPLHQQWQQQGQDDNDDWRLQRQLHAARFKAPKHEVLNEGNGRERVMPHQEQRQEQQQGPARPSTSRSTQPPPTPRKAREEGIRPSGNRPVGASMGSQSLPALPAPANLGGAQRDRISQLGKCIVQRWQELCGVREADAGIVAWNRVPSWATMEPGAAGGQSRTNPDEGRAGPGGNSQQGIRSPELAMVPERRPTATDVAVLSWACFRLGWEPPLAMLYRWVQLAVRRSGSFTPQGLTNILQLASTRRELRRLLPRLAAVVLHSQRTKHRHRAEPSSGRGAGSQGTDHRQVHSGGAEGTAVERGAYSTTAAALDRNPALHSLRSSTAAPGAVTARALMALARARLRVRHWPTLSVTVRHRRPSVSTESTLGCDTAEEASSERTSRRELNHGRKTLHNDRPGSGRNESTGSSTSGSSSNGSSSGKSILDRRRDAFCEENPCSSRTLHKQAVVGHLGVQESRERSRHPQVGGGADAARCGGSESGSISNSSTMLQLADIPSRSIHGAPPYLSPSSRQGNAKRVARFGAADSGPRRLLRGAVAVNSAAAVGSATAVGSTPVVDLEAASAAAWSGWRKLIGGLPPLGKHPIGDSYDNRAEASGNTLLTCGMPKQHTQQAGKRGKGEQTDRPAAAATVSAAPEGLRHRIVGEGQQPHCTAEDLVVAATAGARLRLRPHRLELARIHAALLWLPAYTRFPYTVNANANAANRRISGSGSDMGGSSDLSINTSIDIREQHVPAAGIVPLPGVPDSKLVPLAVALARLQQRAFGFPSPTAQRQALRSLSDGGGMAVVVATAKAQLIEALVVRSTALMRQRRLPLQDLAALGWAVGVMTFADGEEGQEEGRRGSDSKPQQRVSTAAASSVASEVIIAGNGYGGSASLSSPSASSPSSSSPIHSAGDAESEVHSPDLWLQQRSNGGGANGASRCGDGVRITADGEKLYNTAVGSLGRSAPSVSLEEWCDAWSTSLSYYDITGSQLSELCAVLSAWAALRWQVDGRVQSRVLGRLVPELPVLETHRLTALSASLESLGWRLPLAWADWLKECRAGSGSSTGPVSAASVPTA